MASLLIFAQDAVNSDPTVDRMFCYNKGYPVAVHDDAWEPGSSEGPPVFVIIRCPEISKETAATYNGPWLQTIDYNVISADPTNATYQVEAFGDNLSLTGNGALTLEKIENWLLNWNSTVDSNTTNSVVFTISLWQMIQSDGFWDRAVSGFTFNLDSYTEATGVGVITVSGLVAEAIKGAKLLIKMRGGTVEGETASSVTFSINRAKVLDHFKSSVKERVEDFWSRKQYYIDASIVDNALAEPGGEITLTQAELVAAIKNKLDE